MELQGSPGRAHDRPLVRLEESRAAVDVAAGRRRATLRLRGARVLDPFTLALRPAEVWIEGRLVAAVSWDGAGGGDGADADAPRPEPHRTIDLDGGVLTPGLIDGHMHLESSLVSPASYAEVALPRGVTGVVCDPHEVANVAGVAGVRWLLARAAGLPFDVWLTVPSCVPSTELETPGARLGPEETRELLDDPMAVGLAELMSYPQVVAAEEANLRKPLLADGRRGTVEGHAPALRGSTLQAYLAAGVHSDHETGEPHEGLEKLRSGMFVWVREGSVARDAHALAPLVTAAHGERVGFCSDDVLPHDLLRDGGVDHAVRTAIAGGADPAVALKAATWNAARHYRLPRRGAIAPGYLADLTWWRGEPSEMSAGTVFKEGREVARGGRLCVSLSDSAADAPGEPGDGALRDSVRLSRDLDAALTRATRWRGGDPELVPAIGVRPASLLTDALQVPPPRQDGHLCADPSRGLALLVCAERHGHGGGLAVAPVQGFDLARGALAGSIGHDHHNLMAVGADPWSILTALRRVEALGGGLVAAEGPEVHAELPLPWGGLLTDASLSEVRDGLDELDGAARMFGCGLPAPLMALSFLGLAVIPELKLTDHGLVDVGAGRLLPVPWGAA